MSFGDETEDLQLALGQFISLAERLRRSPRFLEATPRQIDRVLRHLAYYGRQVVRMRGLQDVRESACRKGRVDLRCVVDQGEDDHLEIWEALPQRHNPACR